jgi:hypothetical protein
MSVLSERNVQADVRKAQKACGDYVAELLKSYRAAKRKRWDKGVPVIAFCGHGRAGKDLGAEWLGLNFDVHYGGSLSEIVCPLVAAALDRDVPTTFAERHQDRDYWYRFCNELRRDDPTLLAKMLLSKADIVVGVRGAAELEACRATGVIDVSLWIDNPRVIIDPTVEYTEDDCDLTVKNGHTKLAYFSKLRNLAELLKLPKKNLNF